MKYVCFELSMPSNNSWNGKWTGDDNFYALTKKFTDSKAAKILSKGSYGYNFGDGWYANVSAREVTGAEKRKIDKKTKGFCGYEWMIDSIRFYGDILNDKEQREKARAI